MKIPSLTMKKIYDWVKASSLEAIKAFMQWEKCVNDDVVFVCTLGAGDMTCLPASWLFSNAS